MEKLQRQFIDWQKTGKNLLLLRMDNVNLRRYVCYTFNDGNRNCNYDCDSCVTEMDHSISRNELAAVFGVSANVVYNWENGATPVGLEDLLYYCKIAKVDLFSIIVTRN